MLALLRRTARLSLISGNRTRTLTTHFLPQRLHSATQRNMQTTSSDSSSAPAAAAATAASGSSATPAVSIAAASLIDELSDAKRSQLAPDVEQDTVFMEAQQRVDWSAEEQLQLPAKRTASQTEASSSVSIAPPPAPSDEQEAHPPPNRRRSSRNVKVAAVPAAAAAAISDESCVAVLPSSLTAAAAFSAMTSAAVNASEYLVLESDTSATLQATEERDIEGQVVARTASASAEHSTRVVKRKMKVAPVYDVTNYSPQALASRKFIGAHVSAAGGPVHAVYNASAIGARAFAMDTRSKRKWTSPPLSDADAQAFKDALKSFNYSPEQVLPHGSYLANLGSPHAEVLAKSKTCFQAELERCAQLGLTHYNFHPGSTCGVSSKEDCMRLIAANMNAAHKATAGLNGGRGVVTVLENMAGQGGVIGATFQELKFIIDLIEDKSRVGVCIDTCHAYAAGIDLRTAGDVAKMLAEFDAVIGLKYLRGLHLNDSKGDLGCRKDRHESIGSGCIGNEGFRALMARKEIEGIPLILETPCPDIKQARAKYANEIAALYAMEPQALPETRTHRPLPYEEPPPPPPKQKALSASKKSKSAPAASKKSKNNKAKEQEEDEDEDEGEGDEPEADGEEDEEPEPTARKLSRSKSAASSSSSAAAAAAAKPTKRLKTTN